jgi:hypothetical protein
MRKLIIAAVAAASVLATPAMARQSHATSRYLAADAYASVVPYDSYGLFGGYGSYGTHYPRRYSYNPYDSYGFFGGYGSYGTHYPRRGAISK